MTDIYEAFGESISPARDSKDYYIAYHTHTGESSKNQPDSCALRTHYAERCKELGIPTLSTCEHGFAGDLLNADMVCKQNDLKMLVAMEIYYKKSLKDRKAHHIVLIAKNKAGAMELNNRNTEAIKDKDGNWDLSLLLSLTPENVAVTTACLASPLNTEWGEEWLEEVHNHFGSNLYLEIQPHDNYEQIMFNKRLIALSYQHGIKLIAGTDSHYIKPEDAILRTMLLKRKGISYGNEDDFMLDFPTREDLKNRLVKQGLDPECVEEAINNTLDFEEGTVGMDFDNKEIKIPKLYSEKEAKVRTQKIVKAGFKKLYSRNPHLKEVYKKEIQTELDVIVGTNMHHYLLLVKEGLDLGIKDGGVVTTTGRGSIGGSLIGNCFGLTSLDRVTSKVPMLFERFVSVDRLKENCMDVDINIADDKPFYNAYKSILGDEKVYFMMKYDTIQDKEGIKCVAEYYGYGVEFQEELIENMDSKSWRNGEHKYIYDYAEKLKGAIVGMTIHPCAVMLGIENLEDNFGLIRFKNGDIGVGVTGGSADAYKYLKLDLLKVKTWRILAEWFKERGEEIFDVHELEKKFAENPEIWKIVEDGMTATICQMDSAYSKSKVVVFKPQSLDELSDYVASIRPSFASLMDKFLAREDYSYGIPALDKILSSTNGCGKPYLLYQEQIMKMFSLAGISPQETYAVLKGIAKKKIKVIEKYVPIFEKGFAEYLSTQGVPEDIMEDTVKGVLTVIQNSAKYGFNAPHSIAYADDAGYGLYQKFEDALTYFKVAMNENLDKPDITNSLLAELQYFGIGIKNSNFERCSLKYEKDEDKHLLYRPLNSIKTIGDDTTAHLIDTANEGGFQYFVDFLAHVLETPDFKLNQSQVKLLIYLDFFNNFGSIGKLLELHREFYTGKNKYGIKLKSKDTRLGKLRELEDTLNDGDHPVDLMKRIYHETVFTGTSDKCMPDQEYQIILKVKGANNKIVTYYDVATGQVKTIKYKKKLFLEKPIREKEIVEFLATTMDGVWYTDGLKSNGDPKWVQSDDKFEPILRKFRKVEYEV